MPPSAGPSMPWSLGLRGPSVLGTRSMVVEDGSSVTRAQITVVTMSINEGHKVYQHKVYSVTKVYHYYINLCFLSSIGTSITLVPI